MNGLLASIKKHEGFRDRVYDDSLGIPTIGYGFAIKDLVLDEDLAEQILLRKLEDLMLRVNKKFTWWSKSPDIIRDVVMEMCYQLGVSGFSKFKKTIDHLENERYKKASAEMLDSKWAKQTPNRAIEISNLVKAQE